MRQYGCPLEAAPRPHCENNGYAMSATPARTTAVADLSLRGIGMGIPSSNVDGMDALAVRDAVSVAAARARGGEGPTLIVAECYRLMGHFSGDSQKYRTREEVQKWRARDPIWSRQRPRPSPRPTRSRILFMPDQLPTTTYARALNEALREEMIRDWRVIVLGEEVALWGDGGESSV